MVNRSESSSPGGPLSSGGAHCDRRRVLVVNDDAPLAASVRDLLLESNYEPRVAMDGRQALNVLTQWPADLVILDLIMPGMDGWAFLGQLAHSPSISRPLVVVWSVAVAEELERARGLGATECLTRTSTGPQQLLDTVARLLESP
jgi:CheY-like chemotaxis protein